MPDVEWKVKAKHMSEFSNMMRISGYEEGYRFNIIKGAIERHRHILDQAREGKIDLYRSRQQVERNKREKGGISAASWHLKGEVTSTLNIAATPGGELKARLSNALADVRGPDKGRTMVVERGANLS